MYILLMILFIGSIILLIPVILMQSGSGANAGMFGSDLTLGAFGAKSSEVLVKITRWLIFIFMLSALLLGYLKVRELKSLTKPKNQPAITQTGSETTVPPSDEGDVQPPSGADTSSDDAMPLSPINEGNKDLPTLPVQ